MVYSQLPFIPHLFPTLNIHIALERAIIHNGLYRSFLWKLERDPTLINESFIGAVINEADSVADYPGQIFCRIDVMCPRLRYWILLLDAAKKKKRARLLPSATESNAGKRPRANREKIYKREKEKRENQKKEEQKWNVYILIFLRSLPVSRVSMTAAMILPCPYVLPLRLLLLRFSLFCFHEIPLHLSRPVSRVKHAVIRLDRGKMLRINWRRSSSLFTGDDRAY